MFHRQPFLLAPNTILPVLFVFFFFFFLLPLLSCFIKCFLFILIKKKK